MPATFGTRALTQKIGQRLRTRHDYSPCRDQEFMQVAQAASEYVALLTEPMTNDWELFDHLNAEGYPKDINLVIEDIVADFESERWGKEYKRGGFRGAIVRANISLRYPMEHSPVSETYFIYARNFLSHFAKVETPEMIAEVSNAALEAEMYAYAGNYTTGSALRDHLIAVGFSAQVSRLVAAAAHHAEKHRK